MAACVLCPPVNSKNNLYSDVPFLSNAIEEFDEKKVIDVLGKFGNVFVKYNMFSDFALCLVHKHFSMSKHEILVDVESEDSSITVAVPWNLAEDGKSATPSSSEKDLWEEYKLSTSTFIVPRTWAMTAEGELCPFEYGMSQQNRTRAPESAFCIEFIELLKQLGLERIIGIRSIDPYSDHISSYETTPLGKRGNVTVHGTTPDESFLNTLVRVSWKFNSKGELRRDNTEFCIVHTGTCHHCGNCHHCNSHR
ncbi:uncharacterized protein LOC119077425 [Bradysia coprophila]|uniref:uncharacterized protein LOC119077425 n=1 Tax=Bradysia coprophila TaxID=38358 RepID=UPI00187DAA28|nr:uncharacterized protein LOC119077425 [Bradysia coprophila]